MRYQDGWGVSLHSGKFHRLDITKASKGQMSVCGKGVVTPEHIVTTPYPPVQWLVDLLSGNQDAEACKICNNTADG